MRRIARLTLIGLVAALAIPAVAQAGTAGSSAGLHRVAVDSQPNFSDLVRTGQRHGYVILQSWRSEEAAQIKAADPNVKVLAYKNLSASTASVSSSGLYSTGVSFNEADSEHPEWFLHDKQGERFTFRYHSYLWAMDVGSAAYQQRWADNVIRDLGTGPWDGVFVDDTNATMKYHADVSQIEADYDTDAEWQAATRSALASISPQIQAAGYRVIPNFGSWGEYGGTVTDWLSYVDGAMDEMFLKWGNTAGEGYAWEGRFNSQLTALKAAQAQGKDYLAVTHSANGDASAARYGYATTLLGGTGKAWFALHADYTNENYFDFYGMPIGDPAGAETTDSNGVHRRPFSNGLVLVNPSDSSKSVSFGGTYSGSGLASASGATMAPKTALILTEDGGSTEDPPAEDPPPTEDPPAEDPPAEEPGTGKGNGKGNDNGNGKGKGKKTK